MPQESLTLLRPDDWHLHLRDGAALQLTVADSASQFSRAIVMPNLTPPVTTTAMAESYRERILAARPSGSDWQPLMTLYLTDNTSPDEIQRAVESDVVHACKLYPAGATTNSDFGVTSVDNIDAVLEQMQRLKLPLLIHGEVTDASIDIFDREARFIERTLQPLLKKFPELPVVLEHITTADAASFVAEGPSNLAATITAHHLLFNRNHMLVGGIRPHYYCLPILKRNSHQQALIEAATSGNPKFFLGTDSAPHATNTKEAPCGCAGCYTAHTAMELYATAFEQAGKLEKLEGFASHFGADFYGLPRNSSTITLQKQEWTVPETLPMGEQSLTPLLAGETISWRLAQ